MLSFKVFIFIVILGCVVYRRLINSALEVVDTSYKLEKNVCKYYFNTYIIYVKIFKIEKKYDMNSTGNNIVDQMVPKSWNSQYEKGTLPNKTPDIDLTPLDDEAFSPIVCQQRQAAIDNMTYRQVIDQWKPTSLEQLANLVNNLSMNRSEIDRAWIIFYWVSKNIRYDTAAYFNNNIHLQSSTSVFQGGKAVCGGYSTLYADVCALTGLQCRTVNGYAKGHDFDLRQTSFQKTNHAWNILSLKNGHSYFIESTWGSGHVDNFTNQYNVKLVPHYFLCRPEHMIYRHLPDDPQWQLLKKPITFEQYLMLPRTYDEFFELNLRIISPINTHKVTFEKGQSYGEVLIAAPTEDIELSGLLYDKSKKNIEGGNLVYFDRSQKLWRCRFAPQQVGNHKILIFGRKKNNAKDSTLTSTVEFTFDIDQFPTAPISYPLIWPTCFDYQLEIIKPVGARSIDWPSDNNKPYCEILVRSPNDVYISAQFVDSISGSSIKNGCLINYHHEEAAWQCLVAPTSSYTSYKLTLFARRIGESRSNGIAQFDLKQPYNSILRNYISFPSTHSLFQENKCQLLEPLSGILNRESKVKFRCRIPGAQEVNITLDGQQLTSDASSRIIDKNYLFQCDLQVGQNEVAVWVPFNGQNYGYEALLRYLVQ